MKASENKFLKVAEDVVLNEKIETTICLLDPWFEKHSLEAWVSSGVRTYDNQLQIIRDTAINAGLSKIHPSLRDGDLNVPIMYDGKLIPWWILVWSETLARGFMVNPPTPTACLFPYTKPDGTKRNAGNVIPISAHQRGEAFDIGGGSDLDAVVVVVSSAHKSKEIVSLKGYLKEPKQNCCHCDVR